jgi:hypothetical protein
MKNDKDPPLNPPAFAGQALPGREKKSPSVFYKTSGPLAVPTLTKVTVH